MTVALTKTTKAAFNDIVAILLETISVLKDGNRNRKLEEEMKEFLSDPNMDQEAKDDAFQTVMQEEIEALAGDNEELREENKELRDRNVTLKRAFDLLFSDQNP